MLRGSETNKAHIWWISITDFHVFALVSFFGVAHDGLCMSKTADLRIFVDGLEVLVQMSDRLAHWIDYLGFFQVVCKFVFAPVLVFVPLRRGEEVDWSCLDMDDAIFLYSWSKGELIGLAGRRVHDQKREGYVLFEYNKCQLLFIAVCFKADIRLSSLDHAIAGTQQVFGGKLTYPSSDGVAVSGQTAASDGGGDCDFRDMPRGPCCGHELLCIVLSNIHGLVSRVRRAAPENGLDELRLAGCSLLDCLKLI